MNTNINNISKHFFKRFIHSFRSNQKSQKGRLIPLYSEALERESDITVLKVYRGISAILLLVNGEEKEGEIYNFGLGIHIHGKFKEGEEVELVKIERRKYVIRKKTHSPKILSQKLKA